MLIFLEGTWLAVIHLEAADVFDTNSFFIPKSDAYIHYVMA